MHPDVEVATFHTTRSRVQPPAEPPIPSTHLLSHDMKLHQSIPPVQSILFIPCVLHLAGASLTLGSRVGVGEIPGLPVIRYITAGQQHALLSDGERVWVIGKTMDQAGKVG